MPKQSSPLPGVAVADADHGAVEFVLVNFVGIIAEGSS
jgi:hypothetical protein